MRLRLSSFALPASFFILGFLAIPLTQLKMFNYMPGDLGDARLNNYLLENIYQFLLGKSDSLWHVGFFWPFPYVIGFSDNLFGSSPVYILSRVFTSHTDTAFQIWFLFGYAANYWAAYYFHRSLNLSRLSSSVGALIYTFALPVSARAGHAQLHYRFAAPLSILCFMKFLRSSRPNFLALSLIWLVWQLYCGIYMGFFTILFIVALSICYLVRILSGKKTLSEVILSVKSSWQGMPRRAKIVTSGTILLSIVLIIILFYPYMRVTHLYGVKRHWSEISTMLPRPQSYFLADHSWLWSTKNALFFASIPMRWEHQMFPGAVPLLLTLVCLIFYPSFETRTKEGYALMSGSLGLLVVVTINVGGVSPWYLFHSLPLASAIRAMTRIDLVLLLPFSFLSACLLDAFSMKFQWGKRMVTFVIIPFLLFEFAACSMPSSDKKEWRSRLEQKMAAIPSGISKNSVLFFAAPEGTTWDNFYLPELDAMWASLLTGHKTMNGYSGNYPPGPGYSPPYSSSCTVVPLRLLSYLDFARKNNIKTPSYQALAEAIVPIGFPNCNPQWWVDPPPLHISRRAYTKDEFAQLQLTNGKVKLSDNAVLVFELVNTGKTPIYALSGVGHPVRIAWRYLDKACKSQFGWNYRMDLPSDIPPEGRLSIHIPIDRNKLSNSCGMEVSIVQELLFWGHDVGVKPLKIQF